MGRAIVALESVRSELLELRTSTSAAFGALGAPVLSIVRVEGGDAWNMTPDRCELQIGLRLLPDQDRDEWIEHLRTRLGEVLDGERWTLELFNETPSLLTGADTPLHRTAAVCLISRRSTVCPTAPTAHGCSGSVLTASSSARVISAWLTSRTSSCPVTNTDKVDALWNP